MGVSLQRSNAVERFGRFEPCRILNDWNEAKRWNHWNDWNVQV